MFPFAKFISVVILISLVGCYPIYNWRIVQNEEFGWEMLFPAKPKRERRKINVEFQKESKTLLINRYSVVLNGMNFVLDVISFEKGVFEDNVELLHYLNSRLKNNFNINENIELVDGVKIAGYAGHTDLKSVSIILKHVKKKSSLARGIVIGTSEEFQNDKAEFFLKSLK